MEEGERGREVERRVRDEERHRFTGRKRDGEREGERERERERGGINEQVKSKIYPKRNLSRK